MWALSDAMAKSPDPWTDGFVLPNAAAGAAYHVLGPESYPQIKHQIEVFLHTDSKTANLMTKMLGDGAPRMAAQGSEQLLMFFSGIAKFAHDRPEKARGLLTDSGR